MKFTYVDLSQMSNRELLMAAVAHCENDARDDDFSAEHLAAIAEYASDPAVAAEIRAMTPAEHP